MSLVGKEILIVDDDADLRAIVRRILENVGVVVSEADTAAQGFTMMQARHPHLTLCDLGMKPHSGFDLLRLMKNARISVPVIVLSADRSRQSVHQALALGVADYIVKPVEAAVLLQKIRKSLRQGEFLAVEFQGEQRKEVPVFVPAKIVGASEAGFRVAAGIRLAPSTNVKMTSPLLTELKLDGYPLRRGPTLAVSMEKGMYNNEIRLLGVSEEIASRIRKFIRNWT